MKKASGNQRDQLETLNRIAAKQAAAKNAAPFHDLGSSAARLARELENATYTMEAIASRIATECGQHIEDVLREIVKRLRVKI